MKAAREYVEEEAQAVEENVDVCRKPKDLDSDEDESGANDAPLLTAPKAKEAALEASTEVSDQTDIFQECAGGHLEIVKRLVEQARVLLVAEDKVGQLPIHHACKGGHLELVKWLAEQEGVSLTTAETKNGSQPIHIACFEGHLELVKWLADEDGVSLTAKSKEGSQPIHRACFNGHLEVVKWLAQQDGVSLTVEDSRGWQPIHNACGSGNLKLVKWLADEDGVRLTAEDNDGWQPIHFACCNGRLEVAKWLAAQDGVSIDTILPGGCGQYQSMGPLHLAAAHDHADVLSWLVEAKADMNLKDYKGRTALHWASFHANERALSALVHARADIEAQNKFRETPLHLVFVCPSGPGTVWPAGVACGRLKSSVKRKMCAEILLEAGAKTDAANCDGELPLHYAVKYGHPEIAKVLLKYCAATNLRRRNRQKKTPLDLCQHFAVEKAQSGDSDLFQELLNILKQAANDRPAGFSKDLLQKHEQSPQGAFSPMLEVVVGLKSDDAHSTSAKASGASTRTARSMASALVDAKSDDARSVTSSSSKASAASTRASSSPFIPRTDCRFWLNGFCRSGQNCTFKHDSQKKGSGLGGVQGDSPGTGARFGPPVVSTSTPPGPAARQKDSGSAPRAQGATATKNPFGM
jgi:ankyrin repeat protein